MKKKSHRALVTPIVYTLPYNDTLTSKTQACV